MNDQETIAYQGKLFSIIHSSHLINGKEVIFESARRAPGTRLIIHHKPGLLLLTKEFRRELNDYDIRLPGGKVFDSLVEYQTALQGDQDLTSNIEFAARKEALEEVGVQTCDLKFFAKSVLGATVSWDLYYFLITNPVFADQNLEHGEDISLVEFSFKEAEQACLDGRISEERSALQLLRYLKNAQ